MNVELTKLITVGLFPFDDHHPPPFELLDEFCNDVVSLNFFEL